VEVMLRTDFGERYCDRQGPAAILLLFLYASFSPHRDRGWVFAYLVVYLVMYFRAGAGVLRRRWRGEERGHTRYNGFPRLSRLFPKLEERAIKVKVEPLFIAGIGIVFCILNKPLGAYLIAAGAAMFMIEFTIDAYERRRALDLHDSVIEQRFIAERFRRMNRHR
jgi:hypothetical protein